MCSVLNSQRLFNINIPKGLIMHRICFQKFIVVVLIFAHCALQGASWSEKELLNRLHIQVDLSDSWIDELNHLGVLSQPGSMDRLPWAHDERPLFKMYPDLAQNVPHICLGSLPTPIQKLDNLGACFGINNLYIKRDDLTGACQDGEYCYGGNKVRKLEFLLAEALAHNAKSVMTFGCAGSNHAVATSVYANRLGLDCICLLKPQAHSHAVRSNLLMHQSHNAELHYYPNNATRKVGALCAWLDHAHTYGDFPYVIPTGGSNALGTLGFVNAAFELKEQIRQGLMPEPDLMYVPCGSCATTVGLMLGCKLAGLHTVIVPVAVEPEEAKDEFKTNIMSLYQATNALLHEKDPSIPLMPLSEDEFTVNLNFCGTDYAVFSPEGMQARTLLKRHEDILLDGTYTAKAFAAMLDDIKHGRTGNKVVLFWDTYCGLDFSQTTKRVSYSDLPCCFHEYFEQDVQALDR